MTDPALAGGERLGPYAAAWRIDAYPYAPVGPHRGHTFQVHLVTRPCSGLKHGVTKMSKFYILRPVVFLYPLPQ